MRINKKHFKLYSCLVFYYFTPSSFLFTVPRILACMDYGNRSFLPLLSGWVWQIGSFGRWSEVGEWGEGMYFSYCLHVRAPWDVFITIPEGGSSLKAASSTWVSSFYSNCSLSYPFEINKPGYRTILCGSPHPVNTFMNSHFVIKFSLNYLQCSICFLFGNLPKTLFMYHSF